MAGSEIPNATRHSPGESIRNADEKRFRKEGFFAIDRRKWAEVCSWGLNPTVSYLVLARGTGPDNLITAWSVNSIEQYTGISRHRARKALRVLLDEGLVKQLQGGTRPKYRILPWSEFKASDPFFRGPMTDAQRAIYEAVTSGKQPTGSGRKKADTLVRYGWLTKDDSGIFEIAPEVLKPDWIWLPNTLVTGASSETPPVELVRQTQDVMTLRLLVDFYHGHNLREDGGIGREFVSQKFARVEVGQQGQYVVWGFRHETATVYWNDLTRAHRRDENDLTEDEKRDGENPGVDFFQRLEQLSYLGLIEWVPHLFESDAPDAEIIHSLDVDDSDNPNSQLRAAAHEASRALITERQHKWAENKGLMLIPVLRHFAHATVIGIARLRYRPHTRLTSAWRAETDAKCEKWLPVYEKIS